MQIPNEIPAVTAYLANAAWLVVLLAILAELATRLLRPMPAAILHRVWVGCLALAVLLPSLAFLRGNPPAPATITTSRHARLEDETALTGAALPHNKAGKSQADAVPVKHPAMRTSFPNWWSRDGEYLLSFVYLATVLFASMRLIVGLRRAILLQHEGIEATLPAELQRVWERSLERSGVANVRLLASRIANPATLTLGAPVILLPSDMSLTAPAEMAAAFCHELAHVRRNDFLKNLSYEALAALLYFHPAMHWIRRRVQETRELACDDLAAAAIGDRRGYAESLVRLAKGNFEPILRTGYSLGIFDGNVMEERIMNLIETKKKRTGWRVVGAALLAALLLAASCVAGLRFGIRPVFAQSSPSPLTHTFLAPAQSLAAIAKPEPFAAKPSQQKTVVAKTMPIGVGGLALADAGDDLKPVSFTIGQTQFAPGDTIAIDEIRGTTDRIATGNLYEIKGRYTLASRDKALLAANVTTSVDSHAPGMDVERLAVARGSGRFQLWKYMRDPGRLHLSFYPTDDGSSFASIYLEPGTVASAPEKQTSSPAKLPQFNLKFGVITGTFPVAEAAGKTVRFSAWIKTENVHDGYAGLWWRVDGPGKGNDRPTLAFDNSFNRVIADQPGAGDGTVRGATGTTPWTLYQFELPVASTTSNINFGVLLTGTGTAWVDSMKVELDGQPFSAPQYYVDLASPGARNFYTGDGGNGPAAYKGGVDTTVSHSGKQSLKLQYVGNSSAIPQ